VCAAQLDGSGAGPARALREHDPGVAKVELGAGGWIAVMVVLRENRILLASPGGGLGDIWIDDVGEDGVWRHGAIFDHRNHLRKMVWPLEW